MFKTDVDNWNVYLMIDEDSYYKTGRNEITGGH